MFSIKTKKKRNKKNFKFVDWVYNRILIIGSGFSYAGLGFASEVLTPPFLSLIF